MYTNFVPKFNGRYLSSNVNIAIPDGYGRNRSVPVGSRYAKFETLFGRRVTSLGVIFDFTGNDAGTTVQKVEDMVNESWFKEVIEEEPDLFLLVGHMPVSHDKWPLMHGAIRAIHPITPIMIFGGHTHIRDCVQYDGRTMALESGRYMETVGWMSLKLPGECTPASQNLAFSRRYLDPNRVTYEYHTVRSSRTFDTDQGQQITKGLHNLSKEFDLDFVYGTAPHDFTITRDPYPSVNSSLSPLASNATPVALAINNSRASLDKVIIVNSGSQRFDTYAGPFTKNDLLTASPFDDSFLYIPAVPAAAAKQILPLLNKEGSDKRDLDSAREADAYACGWVGSRYRDWLRRMDTDLSALQKRAAQNLTLGYVAQDGCPGVGDDTLHAPLPFYDIPDYIESDFPDVADDAPVDVTDDAPVDVADDAPIDIADDAPVDIADDAPVDIADDAPVDIVFVNFIKTDVINFLNSMQTAKVYSTSDVQTYSSILLDAVLGLYAQQVWN
jgi:hypothetical protein